MNTRRWIVAAILLSGIVACKSHKNPSESEVAPKPAVFQAPNPELSKTGDPELPNRLSKLRSALINYYGDTSGKYPATLEELIPKYLKEIPVVEGLPHPASNLVVLDDGFRALSPDSGHWLYVTNPKSPLFGQVRLDCTHPDAGGTEWSAI